MVSVQEAEGIPRMVWAVHEGRAIEFRVENATQCTYHGCPLPASDPFAALVLRRWEETD